MKRLPLTGEAEQMAYLSIDNFGKSRILVVGDAMLDQYVWGKVVRISPEAPVPILQVHDRSEGAGGAANVALNLAKLGCPVTLVGIVGKDWAGNRLEQICKDAGVQARFLIDPAQSTITKTRIMAQNQQLLRIDEERVHSGQTTDSRKALLALLEKILPDHKAVILSDYGKGVLIDPSVTQRVIELGKENRIPVFVDPKDKDWNRYRGATCVTPNTKELEAISGPVEAGDTSDCSKAAHRIRELYSLEWLLVTCGKQGMCLVGDNMSVLVPARAQEVFDVSGAGDTVIATLTAATVAGLPMEEAAQVANVAAGVVVGKIGTQPITLSELKTALQLDTSRSFGKVMSRNAAEGFIKAWKGAELKIVFTNGCFDLLHPGHIQLLHKARAFGDRLVVGLNTDSSVKRLKGHERPILSEDDRTTMLAALSCVDLVVPFDEDTPLSLIEVFRPDILVKGSDYSLDKVIGREFVESYGGRVELVPVLSGYSTTGIADRISAKE